MDITLLFAGAIVSTLVQIIKKYTGTNRIKTLVAVLILSILGGIGSWYVQYAGLMESFLQIITSAGAVYAFIIKNGEAVLSKK